MTCGRLLSIFMVYYKIIVFLEHMKTGEAWLRSKEKRAFDVWFSSMASPLALPLGVAASVALMLENHHTPMFWQQRVGACDELLRVPKLRTLAGPIEHQASQNGYDHARAAGKLSRWVRKTHFDELPQFGLVIAGTMSVVGPRPIVRSEFEEIMDALTPPEQSDWLTARAMSKPGLANSRSPAQHARGYTNSPLEVAEADITYAEMASWTEDKRIIETTLRAVTADVLHRPVASSRWRSAFCHR